MKAARYAGPAGLTRRDAPQPGRPRARQLHPAFRPGAIYGKNDALAVGLRPGTFELTLSELTPIPEPTVAWMIGTGLLVLAGTRRRSV